MSCVTFPFESREEEIHDVVGECPPILGVDCRPCGVIGKDVRQQRPSDARCFRRRISTGVLQRVRENGDEARVVRWLRSKIGGVLFAGEEGSLI